MSGEGAVTPVSDPVRRFAGRYADGEAETAALTRSARERLLWRLRRGGGRLCAVCGGWFIAEREDAEMCSGACRVRKLRSAEHVRETG